VNDAGLNDSLWKDGGDRLGKALQSVDNGEHESGVPRTVVVQISPALLFHTRAGSFGTRGEVDTRIVLRASEVKDGRMHVQAGAGIVYDSSPEAEQTESVNKARALFRAAEEAVGFAARASAQ
jgi:hypothetical protein